MLLIKPLSISNMTETPATTPIPVQLSEPEVIAFIFPHLSMPRRGPRCKLGYHCVFNLILVIVAGILRGLTNFSQFEGIFKVSRTRRRDRRGARPSHTRSPTLSAPPLLGE